MTSPDQRLGNPPVDLLWVLAHPDDETYGSGGTIAWASDRGLRTAYICATRGEAGAIRDTRIATTKTLGAVREQELREAMSHVGLAELRLLGYRDSGMEDTPENEDPRAFIQQPREAILAHLVGHIRDLRPATVITFGPEGIYGHPDHILVGELTVRAVSLAADAAHLPGLHVPWRAAALYHTVAPREAMLALADHPDQPLGAISERSRNNLGTPSERITHWLDVTPWLERKARALAAHRTQFADRDSVVSATDDERRRQLGTEQLARQPLPWDPDMRADDPISRAHREIGREAPAYDLAGKSRPRR
jgi:LmbE family N-acetylglucosaminyl deacetylase